MTRALVLLLAAGLAACGGAADLGPATEPAAVQLAIEQLADRLGISESEIEVASVKSVQWPDASLGCEMEPGTFERQATPGFVVALESQDERYVFHTDQGDRAVQCELELPHSTEETKEEMGNEQVQMAVADLAGRLDIHGRDIEVVSVEEVTWRDGSMGCPQPGRAYTQALVNGSRIILEADGRTWYYHSGAGRDPFLCMIPQEPLSSGDDPGSGYGDY